MRSIRCATPRFFCPGVGNILVTRFCIGNFWFLFLRIANLCPFIVSCSKITCFIAVAGIGGAVAVVISREYFDYFKEASLFFLKMVNSRFLES